MVSAMMMADTLSPTPQLSTFNSPDEDDFCTQPPHQQHNEEMVFESAGLAEIDQSFSNTSPKKISVKNIILCRTAFNAFLTTSH